MRHRWTSTADHPCWCGEFHTLREAWRLNHPAASRPESFGSSSPQSEPQENRDASSPTTPHREPNDG